MICGGSIPMRVPEEEKFIIPWASLEWKVYLIPGLKDSLSTGTPG
jgi:hypothetical protein